MVQEATSRRFSLRRFAERFQKRRYERARMQIKSTIISSSAPSEVIDVAEAYSRSTQLLGSYVTLDWKHRIDIQRIIGVIRQYADDRTRRRPLNIIMPAEPGSGKSHLVKCLAQRLDVYHATAVDFNMASLQSVEDFIQPLESVRNLKVQDRLPILFLDEFDSDPRRYPLLLPLMWDGELRVGHRDLKLGKLVIFLAGSGKNIQDAMKAAKGMQCEEISDESKLIDLLSRINGGELEIPPLDLVDGDRDRRVDKVCLTVALLENRFGRTIELIPWALLRFVAVSRFRYGVRSITHLIDLVPPIEDEEGEVTLKSVSLPLTSGGALEKSSLAYHLTNEEGPGAIVDQWRTIAECRTLVRVRKRMEKQEMEASGLSKLMRNS